MKILSNLPGRLRIFFGVLRILTAAVATIWLLSPLVGIWWQSRFTNNPKLWVGVGKVLLPIDATPVEFTINSAEPRALLISALHGDLAMDLCSKDNAGLVSALCWTVLPIMAVTIAFCWVLFSSLRDVCANIERGELFSDRNLGLVRKIGITLIGYSLVGVAIGLWSIHVMDGYLSEHVKLMGKTMGSTPSALRFNFPEGVVPFGIGLVTGCLVLMVSEAFRQGLRLKNEIDLTV